MPIFEYEKPDGTKVEKIFKFKDRPKEIVLEDGTIATLVLSLPATMKINWKVTGTVSDLPDEDA